MKTISACYFLTLDCDFLRWIDPETVLKFLHAHRVQAAGHCPLSPSSRFSDYSGLHSLPFRFRLRKQSCTQIVRATYGFAHFVRLHPSENPPLSRLHFVPSVRTFAVLNLLHARYFQAIVLVGLVAFKSLATRITLRSIRPQIRFRVTVRRE